MIKDKRLHIETPVIKSHKLSQLIGKEVLLKMECYQPVGSFKMRGMGLLCQTLVSNGITHLFSSSGGNAGYAIAFGGRRLGVDVTIVVPETTNASVCETIKSEGAKVEKFGREWDAAHQEALRLSKISSGGYLHPFDDPVVWDGHSSIIDESINQCEKPDVIILSVGGGGLFCGVMAGLQRNAAWKDVPVITVETEGADSLYSSVKSGKLVRLDAITSLAVTLGVKQVSSKAFEWGKSNQVTPTTVTDLQAIRACRRFVDDHRVLVEPACGAALAVVYDNLHILTEAKSILVIVCGGIGVNLENLNKWEKQLEN